MRFIGILLAAGRGARFGGAKLLTPIPASSHGVAGGTTIGAAAAMHMVAALTDVVAVVRPGDTVLRHELEATGARVVVCDRADEGMGTSLAFAVGETLAVAPDADGFIVALADMPWIAPATILAVATALADGAEMVAPAYRGERGHPVGFARAYDTALKALTGDAGARAIIAARLWVLRVIEVDDPGVVLDVDQPDDLRS
jgi:molybdenum cofactor cytidylyltransferase